MIVLMRILRIPRSRRLTFVIVLMRILRIPRRRRLTFVIVLMRILRIPQKVLMRIPNALHPLLSSPRRITQPHGEACSHLCLLTRPKQPTPGRRIPNLLPLLPRSHVVPKMAVKELPSVEDCVGIVDTAPIYALHLIVHSMP